MPIPASAPLPAPRSSETPLFVLSSAGPTSRLVPASLRSEILPRIEFHEDRVVIWRADIDHSQPNCLALELTAIGHVQFVPPGRITLGYGISPPGYRLYTEVKVSKLVAEDRFDQIVSHLESHAPDHLFSYFDRHVLRHSKLFALADVLPVSDPVTHAQARVISRDPLQIEYTTSHNTWSVTHETGFVLRADGASQALLQVLRSQFFKTNGMVLGSMPQFASSAYCVDVGGSDTVLVHEFKRSLYILNSGTFFDQRSGRKVKVRAPLGV